MTLEMALKFAETQKVGREQRQGAAKDHCVQLSRYSLAAVQQPR